MLELDKQTRDEIVKFLQGQIVPAQIGAGLIQVANILMGLKEAGEKIKEEKKDGNI